MKSKKFWNTRYKFGDSGLGSYGEQRETKLRLIDQHIKRVDSILDFGCGDFAFGSRVVDMFKCDNYVGIDQSKEIIKRNKRIYSDKFTFLEGVGVDRSADLIMCMDVLFHVTSQVDYDKITNDLQKHWSKYLILTAHDTLLEQHSDQYKARDFDESLFGDPIVKHLLEDGGAYLYIFKK
jgi:hypothetical protein